MEDLNIVISWTHISDSMRNLYTGVTFQNQASLFELGIRQGPTNLDPVSQPDKPVYLEKRNGSLTYQGEITGGISNKSPVNGTETLSIVAAKKLPELAFGDNPFKFKNLNGRILAGLGFGKNPEGNSKLVGFLQGNINFASTQGAPAFQPRISTDKGESKLDPTEALSGINDAPLGDTSVAGVPGQKPYSPSYEPPYRFQATQPETQIPDALAVANTTADAAIPATSLPAHRKEAPDSIVFNYPHGHDSPVAGIIKRIVDSPEGLKGVYTPESEIKHIPQIGEVAYGKQPENVAALSEYINANLDSKGSPSSELTDLIKKSPQIRMMITEHTGFRAQNGRIDRLIAEAEGQPFAAEASHLTRNESPELVRKQLESYLHKHLQNNELPKSFVKALNSNPALVTFVENFLPNTVTQYPKLQEAIQHAKSAD